MVSHKFYIPIGMVPLAAPPAGPAVGDTYFDTTMGQARTWDGVGWSEGIDGKVDRTGDVMSGSLVFTGDLGGLGRLVVSEDSGNPGSDALHVHADDGMVVDAAYYVLDTQNPVMTMSGGVTGSPLQIAGFDSLGGALLGWGAPLSVSLEVEDTNEGTVVIKPAGPLSGGVSPWVSLGLVVVVPEDVLAGEASITFVVPLVNGTSNRSGTVEFGVGVGGSPVVELPTNPTVAVPAGFNQSFGLTSVNLSPYPAGTALELWARVVQQNNNQFTVSMVGSPGFPGVFRVSVAAAGAQGPAGPTGPAGPSAVSVDAGNTAVLGADSLIFVPRDAAKLDVAGGTLTGVLVLAADPVAALQAATKAYVDAALNSRVFTDDVVLSAGVPVGVAHGLGSDRVVVQVYSGGVLAECDVTVDSVDSVVVESSVDILVAAVNIMSVAVFAG